jgi:hypothetical protein
VLDLISSRTTDIFSHETRYHFVYEAAVIAQSVGVANQPEEANNPGKFSRFTFRPLGAQCTGETRRGECKRALHLEQSWVPCGATLSPLGMARNF